jgi:hypothetical protein
MYPPKIQHFKNCTYTPKKKSCEKNVPPDNYLFGPRPHELFYVFKTCFILNSVAFLIKNYGLNNQEHHLLNVFKVVVESN